MNSWACAARAAASMASRDAPRHAVGDVVRDRVVEEHGLLRHERDLLAQRPQRDVADVDAVDENRAFLDVVEPRNQVHERGLARAAQTDDGHHLSGAHGERRVRAARTGPAGRRRQSPTSRNSTAARSRGSAGAPGCSCTSVCVSSMLEDALGRRDRLLDAGVHAAQLLDRACTS